MKKTIAFVIVICVTAALFASVGITVRAGGAFGFADLSTCAAEDSLIALKKENRHKVHGFGFDGSVSYDISDKFIVYADFNLLFPKDDLYTGNDGQEKELSKRVNERIKAGYDGSYKIEFYSISAGAAYRFDLEIPVRLTVGAGLSFNHLKGLTMLIKDVSTLSKTIVSNLGLNAMVDAKYMFNESIGVGLTVIPQVVLYNFSKIENSNNGVIDEKYSASSNGFKVSFAMPVTIGASYSF